MPIIRIEYDNNKINKEEILSLSEAIQKIVSQVTKIEDVSVFSNSSDIRIKAGDIEIFVEMSASKIDSIDLLLKKIREELSIWKKKSQFKHPINLSLLPMNWKFEIGI